MPCWRRGPGIARERRHRRRVWARSPGCRPAERRRPGAGSLPPPLLGTTGRPGAPRPRPTRSRRRAREPPRRTATSPSASRAAEAVRSRRAVFIALHSPGRPVFLSLHGAMLRHALRSTRALRTLAWGAVAVGIATPLVRHRLRLRPPVVSALTWPAPAALALAAPRTPLRDAGIYALQMWAYFAHFDMPDDDPEAFLRARQGRLPDRDRPRARARHAAHDPAAARARERRGDVGPLEYGLSAVHWSWFLIPHGTCAYILLRHRALLRALGGPDGRLLRRRLHRLLGAAHRSAVVRGRAGQAAAGAPDHGRGGRALLGTSLGAAIPFSAREPICRDALTPLRYVRDGSAPAQPDRTGARRGGLGIRTDARLRPRLPGRALRG